MLVILCFQLSINFWVSHCNVLAWTLWHTQGQFRRSDTPGDHFFLFLRPDSVWIFPLMDYILTWEKLKFCFILFVICRNWSFSTRSARHDSITHILLIAVLPGYLSWSTPTHKCFLVTSQIIQNRVDLIEHWTFKPHLWFLGQCYDSHAI